MTDCIGMANSDASSFRKIPERSLMPGALLSSIFFSILNTLFDSVFGNGNLQTEFLVIVIH